MVAGPENLAPALLGTGAGRVYIKAMSSAFPILIVIAVLAVLGVLFVGVFSMARGGEFNAKYANKLMRLRVLMQLIALIIIAAALLFSGR